MHPDGRAAGDPLRDRLVREDLALPAGDGAEQRDPVADLLASVAAIALDFRVGEADERLDVGARDVVQHPAVELGVDPPGLGRTHPVRDPAGGEQRDALPRRPGPDERPDERANLVAAARRRQGRRRAVRVDRRDRHLSLRRQEVQGDRQLVPALDLVGIREVEAGGEAALEERHAPLGRAPHPARRDPHQPRAARARRVVGLRQADAEGGHVAVGEVLDVVVHEQHDEIRARRGEPPMELVEAAVQPVPPLGHRHLGPSRDERRVGRGERRDDLGHGPRSLARLVPVRNGTMRSVSRPMARWVSALVLVSTLGGAPAAATAGPDGQMTWAVHISLAPTWFDPAETPGVIAPFMFLCALHDALVKPMPGNPMAPSLAESWSTSRDGLTYEFALRKGVRFHNGDLLTADDVKFSFERYRGAGASALKARVVSVEAVDASRVRFRLRRPWPDFMTFYGTPATGAAWVVPRKYVERVGDDGFKKAPVGAGPYRFVSFTPGVELVLEAFEQYWRKAPSVKRLVLKAVPDEATRLAMLKRGEADIAYSIRSALAEELQRTPGLTLKPTSPTFTEWLVFTEQWEPKSPWADRRVRLAVNLAVDRKSISDAEYLGFAKISSGIIPRDFEFSWAAPPYPYDPATARQLLAEAGYPRGFDAGDVFSDNVYVPEAIVNYLQAVGIRARLRPLERAAFYKADQEKKLRGLVRVGSAAFGNAATRIEAFVVSGGIRAYGGYPDIDGLYREQAGELDPKKREAILHRIQQLMHERVMFAPIIEPAFLSGQGPRVGESGFGRIVGAPYSLPYEDLTLRAR